METISSRRNWLNFAGLVLVLPSACFFCINMLNEAGVDGPYNASQPVLESLGIREQFGWNINLLVLFGPILALVISLFQVLGIEWHFTKEQFDLRITIQRKWFPLMIAFISGLVLATLFIYLWGENF